MKTTPFGFIGLLIVLAILLSAIYAEGRQLDGTVVTTNSPALGKVVANEKWRVISEGSVLWAQNRLTGENFTFWLDNGTSQGHNTSSMVLRGDLLIAGGNGTMSSTMVGVWMLNALSTTTVQRARSLYWEINNTGVYTPQNWGFEQADLIKFIFTNKDASIIGVYDGSGYVTIRNLFELSPIQEFFVGEEVTDLAFDEDFLAIGNGGVVQLYKYDRISKGYERIANYQGGDNSGRKYGLGISTLDYLYVLLRVGSHFEALKINMGGYNEVCRFTLSTPYSMTTGSIANILTVEGEIAVIGPEIVHVPSGLNMGQISQQSFKNELGYEFHATVRDTKDGFNIVSVENLGSSGMTYISTFSEPTLKVSKPEKVRRGAVEFLTIPGLNPDHVRVLRGGDVHLAISASPGNRLYSIKEGGVNKIVTKEVGSVIYAVSNVQSDLEVSATFKKSKGMKEYSVYTPTQKTIGRPLPTGEKPWKWFTSLSPGTWVTYKVNPVDVWTNIFTKIIVKPNGKISTFPLVF